MPYDDGQVVDGREALDRLMSEEDLGSKVEKLLEMYGWRWCHFRPARIKRGEGEQWRTPLTGDKGLPDYVAVRGGRLIMAELKSSTGKLSPDQQLWHDELVLVLGIEVYVWRPRDWDEIVETLKPEGRSVRVT